MVRTRYVEKYEALDVMCRMHIFAHYKSATSTEVGVAICKAAVDNDVTAIVIAKSNKGAMKKLFVGSVAAYVSRHSPVPVMVVPTHKHPTPAACAAASDSQVHAEDHAETPAEASEIGFPDDTDPDAS